MTAPAHFRDSGRSILSIVGAEVAVVLMREGERIAFSGRVVVPFAESRGGAVMPWGLRAPLLYTVAELVSAVAADATIEAFRVIAARQAKELTPILDKLSPPSAFGQRRRLQYKPNGNRVRGLNLLMRSGASVDVLALVDGQNTRWRGTVLRPPTSPTASVEIRPHGIAVDGISIEICAAQIVDVTEFDPHCRTAIEIARLQRQRFGGGGVE